MNSLTFAWGGPSEDAAGVFWQRGRPAEPVGTTYLSSVFSASVSFVCIDLGVSCIAIAAQHHPSVTRSRSLISVKTRTRTHHREEEKWILKVDQINNTDNNNSNQGTNNRVLVHIQPFFTSLYTQTQNKHCHTCGPNAG